MALTNSAAGRIASLPAEAQTRGGFIFSPEASIWRIPDQRASLLFDFSALGECCTEEIVTMCKKALLIYLGRFSGSHSHNMFERFKHYARTIAKVSGQSIKVITSVSLMNYKANLSRNESWFFGTLSGFLIKWRELGYPGVDDDVPLLLKGMRNQGNKKGEAILTHDPVEGPFSDSELTDLLAAVNDAFAEGVISVREYLLVLLFAAFCPRPIQVACLKLKDFRVVKGSVGAVEYFLDVPRAKQRNSLPRAETTTRILVAEIGEILSKWVEHVQHQFAGELADGFLVGELPLFPTRSGAALESNKGFDFHTRATAISDEIVTIFGRVTVVSSRTGEPLNVFPTRFRRTLGTRAAEEGHSELIIAQLLDHSDTQNARVYVQATPKILERIDKVLSQYLAPLAQAFHGKVISDPSEAVRAGDPAARIRSPYSPEKDNGVCGKYGFCSASAPVACYTCKNFQAWLDGPHEQVLEALIQERERVYEVTRDIRIASANDLTIVAVKAVIKQCNEMKNRRGAAL